MADTVAQPGSDFKGRFEVTRETFEETVKGRDVEAQELDLKDALPDVFAHTQHIPRLVEKVWRKACDDILTNNRGIYSMKPDTLIIQFYFYKLEPVVAKVKVSLIKGRMPALLSSAMSDEKILDAPAPVDKEAVSEQRDVNAAKQKIARLESEGLTVNPSLELLHLWASRTVQNMITSGQTKLPLTREMMDVVSKSDITYLPLWNSSNQALIGSYGSITVPFSLSQYNTGETLRQELAMLFNAVFYLYSMMNKGQGALIIISCSLNMLQDKVVGELYMGILRRLGPEVRKNLIIEFKNVPKDSIPSHMVTLLDAVNQCVRAIIFETSLLTYRDYNKNVPKLHACGIDSAEGTFDENDQIRFLRKYAEFYNSKNLKTYIKNVSSMQVFKSAVECGFTYIASPLVRSARKDCFTAEKLPLSDIKG